MTLVVDASVAWKWYVRETDSDLAEALVTGAEALVAPSIIVAEVCNAAWKLARRGELSAAQAESIAGDIARQFDALIAPETLARAATSAALALDHPVYDCLYLVLAVEQDSQLVTADSRLFNKTRRTRWARRVVDLSSVAV